MVICGLLCYNSNAVFSNPAATAARFSSVSGVVSYKSAIDEAYVEINIEKALQLAINENDRLMIPAATTAEIVMTCGATVKISPKSEVQIGYNNIRLNRGGIWVNYVSAKRSDGKITFKVETPAGTAGVKGTQFVVKAIGDQSEKNKKAVQPQGPAEEKINKTVIQVNEGVVNFETGDGQSCDIIAGEKLSYIVGSKLCKPFKANASENILDEGNSISPDVNPWLLRMKQ